MSITARDFRQELERIRNVSDMLCTGHAGLRERYARLASVLALAILASSTWIVALVFVEPRINLSLTPFGLDPQLWVGLIAVATFFLTIVQVKTDWKGRSEVHRRSFAMYAEVKRECGYLLASEDQIVPEQCERLLARYDMATEIGAEVPEKEFLKQKRRHKLKVALSRHLDDHPAASILLTKIRFFFRDNFGE